MNARMRIDYSREENIVRRNEVSRRACATTLDEIPDICYARINGTRETCPGITQTQR